MASPRHAHVQFTKPDLALAEAERLRFKNARLALNTTVSYQRDWRVFTAWCQAAQLWCLPATADTVELYICDMLNRGRKVTTLERHTVAIQYHHRQAGLDNPCGPSVRSLLAGAKRTLCQQPDQKDAITVENLRQMVQAIGHDTAIAARDSALLLFGYATALRRSNLASMRLEHLEFLSKGIVVQIEREKQDRKGVGRQLAVPYGEHPETCPVKAVERWLDYRGKDPGPLFCHVMRGHCIPSKPIAGNHVARIIQDAAERIGLDRKRIGAHSLRAGLATAALENGCDSLVVARHTGHASLDMLRRYYRSIDLWRGNPGGRIGL
jgi:site-specific recombinase XerD